MLSLKDQAIKNALENSWDEAEKLNKQILEENPNDIDTLNRLAFSLLKLGKFTESKKTYRKVILLDKTNPIAVKNLKKIDAIEKQKIENIFVSQVNGVRLDELFIEEAGKTKIIELKNVADKSTLSLLQPGDNVNLIIKRSKIFVQSPSKHYIGMLPDNIGFRLIPFMQGGNEYLACIKSINDKTATIFMKELKKAKKYKNQPSFIAVSPTNKKEK